ncbi:MAG: glycosyltransferase family 2 protein [Candidatus Helarchaeota archaeon]
MNKIAFILPAMLRDDLLKKSIESLLKYKQNNWEIIIVDQGYIDSEKKQWAIDNLDKINFFNLPFNSGLSACRNFGIKRANDFYCDYTIIASDSFLFNESILKLNQVIELLKTSQWQKIGFELWNCICRWEGQLKLIPKQSFNLNFINSEIPHDYYDNIPIWNVDICRNFYIATTKSLLNVPFDENLKCMEHEDQAYRYSQLYNTLWTNIITATKMTDRPNEYKQFRDENMREGRKYLKNKWNIKDWITYQNLNLAKINLTNPS